jgi:ABC-2 type transport system ATP-binding protein
VFLNSHLLMEVELVCHRVVIMHQGRVLREGPIDELTPTTGNVRVRLASAHEDLEQLLAGLGRELKRLEPGAFELLGLEDGQLDQAVDRLRAAGLSIRAIEPRRLTLEEAFIDEVQRSGKGAGA